MPRKRISHPLCLRALAAWLTALSLVVCSGLTPSATLAAALSPMPAGAERPTGAPPSCLGANDLLVSGETIVMSGTEVLDHLCVIKKGRIVGSGDLRLKVGVLYVDANSAISMDGRYGGLNTNHDCTVVGGGPEGSAGYSLTIAADQVTIAGSLSANGGKGMPNTLNCSTLVAAGNGGDGGSISLTARHLTVSGSLSAHGGAGGAATAPAYATALGPSRKPSGAGGNGGTIILQALATDLARPHGTLDAQAGNAGKPGIGGSGGAGRAGTVRVVPLAPPAAAALPPEPAPLLVLAATAPAIRIVPAVGRENLPCGSGDLVIPAGATRILSGVRQFNHVCIAGTVHGTGALTLVAQTIEIARTGVISLDGRSPLPFRWSDSGRYGDGGACAGDHGAAQAGMRGSITAPSGVIHELPDLAARSGEGGGSLTLIAGTLALHGQVRANGGAGQAAFSVSNIDGPETWAGSGGGSGGGITIYAHRLALDGRIATIGGVGGNGSGPGHVDGARGSGGCVKVFAGQIDSTQASPAIVGSAFVDAPGPADPVAPPLQTGSGLYVAATHHTLGEPFLGYWRGHGGLATLGYPLTGAFSDHGVLEQYTERALLTASGGSVRTGALGTALTAARHFPPVAQAGPGARYFAATSHSLGGRFLAYWLSHQGASILGAPISEVLNEGNGDGSGRRYLMQWFERGRLEYHPENAGPYAMELGLVGRDALRARGWLPQPTAAAQPADREAGRLPGAKLYALEANGDIFQSDGSQAWQYRWGSLPDPAQCRATTLAGPANGAVVYVAAAGALIAGMPPPSATCVVLWRSVGGSLRPVPDVTLPPSAAGESPEVLVALDGRVVYAWTWSTGMAKSTDSGATWSRVALPGGHVLGLVQDPGRPGHLWLQMGSGGPTRLHLYQSNNAGDSWQEIPTRGTPIAAPQSNPVPMAADPRFPGGLWIGSNHGLLHTMNGGQTWEHIGGGLPPTMWVDGLAVSPFDEQRLLVWREGAGLYSSADGGRTWQRSPGVLPSSYGCGATFDPLDRLHVYLACNDGLYASDDGGRDWSKGAGLAGATGVLVSTGHPGLAYAVGWAHSLSDFLLHGEVFRTTDGGGTWQPWVGGDMLASDTIVGIAGFVP